MSIIICKHCSKHIDTDFDCEHEEVCGEELKEKIRTELAEKGEALSQEER